MQGGEELAVVQDGLLVLFPFLAVQVVEGRDVVELLGEGDRFQLVGVFEAGVAPVVGRDD